MAQNSGIPLDWGDDVSQKKIHGTPQRGVATMQLTSPYGTTSSDSESHPRHETRPRKGSIQVAPVDALMSAKKPKRQQGKQKRPRAQAIEAPPELAKAKSLGPAFEASVESASAAPKEVAQPAAPRRRAAQAPRAPTKPWTAYYATAKSKDKLAAWRQEWRTALGWGQPNARYFQPRNHILI